jgi:hypothetical protein
MGLIYIFHTFNNLIKLLGRYTSRPVCETDGWLARNRPKFHYRIPTKQFKYVSPSKQMLTSECGSNKLKMYIYILFNHRHFST